MYFEPIAIIGQACILPGALNPKALWDQISAGKDLLSKVPNGYWRTDPKLVLAKSPENAYDLTWTDRGGYVNGFNSVFDPDGFAIAKTEILKLDPLVHWIIHTAREALRDAGYLGNTKMNAGAVFGNLSYPSHSLQAFSESLWLESQGNGFCNGRAHELTGTKKPDAINRFMSGLPAHILARSLELTAGAFAIDASCASSLYAVKLACDQLQSRKTDLMIAGGVNRADDLIIHVGFCSLQAMSHTGQSRPFHKEADGLVPAEGAGFIALKRLDDAVAAGDMIHGVIRGVGLSNDGKGHGLLVPSEEGQVRALRRAYEVSGLSPEDISLIECHATGTPVGDDIEIRSMTKVFDGLKDIPIGTIKSNMGHPITVSGVAGILKVLGAIKAGVRPATLHVEKPNEKIEGSPFRLLKTHEPWDDKKPRRAAISNFGFGGNNAHLIVEEWDKTAYKKQKKKKKPSRVEIAIIGMGAMVADTAGVQNFAQALFSGKSHLRKNDDGALGGYADSFDLPLMGLRFFPAALDQTLPQQLIILKATLEAVADAGELPRERTGVMVGMGCDTEVTRSGLCWRINQWLHNWTKEPESEQMKEWALKAKDHINPARKAPAILGAMPNIVANRLCSQFDIAGPSFTVSSEELSGIKGLELAIHALKYNDIDVAVVGAVDMSCEPIHQQAAKEVLDEDRHVPGDAAITLVLKRLEDARKDGNKVYAIFSDEVPKQPDLKLGLSEGYKSLTPVFGHAHAASGLLHVAAAALACHYRALPPEIGQDAKLWLKSKDSRSAEINIEALGGESATTTLKEDTKADTQQLLLMSTPGIHVYSGIGRQEILRNLKKGNETDEGPARLVLVAENSEALESLKAEAQHLLEKENSNHFELSKGIYFRKTPIDGELSFVFTGSAGVYPGMGRELLFAFPEITDNIISRFGYAKETAEWIYETDINSHMTPEKMLWGSSFLSQLHAKLTQQYFGLTPKAVLGFSSGESNSLFAMEAWRDMDQMAREFHEMGVFSHEVGGEFKAIKEAWKDKGIDKVNWMNWGVLAPEEDVLSAIEDEPLVHLLIINAPGEVVIGGEAGACERVIKKIGHQRTYPLPYHMANHCPELETYADKWRKLHHRETFDVPDVRFYTGSTCSFYNPTADQAADAILGMACRTLDFPKMVENAWNDGVRVFLEHGPRASCSKWIAKILKDKEHTAIPMDRSDRSSVVQLVHALAQLVCAGIDVDYQEISTRLVKTQNTVVEKNSNDSAPENASRTYNVHPPKVKLPPIIIDKEIINDSGVPEIKREQIKSEPVSPEGIQFMLPPPVLPSVFEQIWISDTQENNSSMNGVYFTENTFNESLEEQSIQTDKSEERLNNLHEEDSPMKKILKNVVEQNEYISSVHKDFLSQQAKVHKKFLELRQNALSVLTNTTDKECSTVWGDEAANSEVTHNSQQIIQTPPNGSLNSSVSLKAKNELSVNSQPSSPQQSVSRGRPVPPVPSEAKLQSPVVSSDKQRETSDSAPEIEKQTETSTDPILLQFKDPVYIEPVGPTFSKDQLEILASGKISEVFGPMFKIQDDYERQVRLPEHPLLLADRITGLKAEPGSMGKGIIWTETDVVADAWYINDVYMPAGVTVESGQCDLTLVSYLGADFKNKGERIYRLLGCDLMYYGEPPRVGDTLCYQIHVDGHANMGATRIFFFRYDCRINGELRLSVRNAQAGFFSDEELANSGGILWTPEKGDCKPIHEVVIAPPEIECTRNKFSKEQVKAFSEGHVYECFGPGFEISQTHSKTPKLQSGMMLLLDEVTSFDPKGGPWERGYLRVENRIPDDAWYLTCHFKNDPCMPGTLMSDACLQTLAFYLTAMGHTLKRDGWRFDPIPNEVMNIKCRGQVNFESDHLIYEIFVEEIEIVDGLYPTIYADILATCDGLKILHIRRMGLRLVPDFPLDCWPHLLEGYEETRPVAKIDEMEFGYKSLLACAFGKPSEAFGPPGQIFDTGRHIARLPGPPYHFMTRVSMIDATPGAMKKDEIIEVEYDIPPDAWYFDENGNRTMPFCVLMEVALQPCGWLAVFEGGPATSEDPLYFRNLDGTGKIVKEIFPNTGTVKTRTTLVNISRIAGVTLVRFDVECFVGDTLVYEMSTGFGFFAAADLSQQIGLGATDDEIEWLDQSCDFQTELTEQPEKYFDNQLRLPGQMLLMIDRITGYWPEGGPNGLGRMRAEKAVNLSEWFFKAHFFHDPVQPGSLGVEAIVQTLQFYMIHEGLEKGIENPRFEPIALDSPVTWRYRGQVTPDKKRISVELNILEKGKDEKGAFVVAEGWLWADTLRIFHVKDLKMYIVSSAMPPDNKRKKTKKDLVTAKSKKTEPVVKLNKSEQKAIKEKIAKIAQVKPTTVKLVNDGRDAVCDHMPLTLYPVKLSRSKNKKAEVELGESYLNFDRMLAHGRKIWDIGPWVGEKFTQGLCRQFVRNVVVEDPKAFKKLKGKSVLYLANHQVQVESMLFPMIINVLAERRAVAIANSLHQTAWLGPLDEFTYNYPGVTYPRNIVYFDQTNRESMFDILDSFKNKIASEGISVFLHVEGRLGLSCRHPVKILSSVFIDLAQDSNLPIVPVRFTGGLPVEEMKTTLDFPLGYSKQDYYIGRPIYPEDLEVLPYAERRKVVINAINSLGPSNEEETPNESDSIFLKDVNSWITKKNVSEVQSVLFKVLERLEVQDEETKAIVKAASGLTDFGKDAKGRWLAELASWLFD